MSHLYAWYDSFHEVCVTGLNIWRAPWLNHQLTATWPFHKCDMQPWICDMPPSYGWHAPLLHYQITNNTHHSTKPPQKATHSTTPPQKSPTFPQYYIYEPPIYRSYTTGWRRLITSPKLQIIFHKRATKYRSLLRKMNYKNKGSYKSSPPYIRLPATTTELYFLKGVSPTTQLCLLRSDH